MDVPLVSEYEALFTSTSGTKQCNKCKELGPSKNMFYMRSVDPGRKGRLLCQPCHSYYLQKQGTVCRLGQDTSAQHQPDPAAIHKQVAEAQRMVGTSPVKAVGNNMVKGSLAMSPIEGPVIATPYRTRQPIALPFPTAWDSATTPGYQDAHTFYYEMRKHFEDKAREKTKVATEVITVTASMAYRSPKKRKEEVLGHICDALNSISVHIGGRDLKRVVYTMLLHRYLSWFQGHPLSIDECELRTRKWVEIVPAVPDVDVVAKDFFEVAKKKSGPPVFKPRQGLDVYLAISYDKYEAALEHCNRVLEAEEVDSDQPSHRASGIVGLGKKRKREPQGEMITTRGAGSSGQSLATVRSPEAKRVRKALQAQSAPGRRKISSLYSTMSVDCHVSICPPVDLDGILKDPTILLRPWAFEKVRVTLSYDRTMKSEKGTFKSAVEGTSSVALFSDKSLSVCLKQAICHNPGMKPVLYESQMQAESLTMELNCIGWGQALMDLVYRFVDAQLPSCGNPPLSIPRMRFVGVGLAIGTDQEKKTYLVEEFIDPKTEGPFAKYITNASPSPFFFPDEATNSRALFLSFSQHVQYVKTNKLVFVSDYQGGCTLLTDPQIITAPELNPPKPIFADGNTGFRSLEKGHECNSFCKHFGLDPFQVVPVNVGLGEEDMDIGTTGSFEV